MTATISNLSPTAHCKLTDQQVETILLELDHLTMRQVADRYGLSTSAVQKIRTGLSYAWVLPDFPRRNRRATPATGPRCTDCVHDHHGRCSLGLPERQTFYGDRAATVCAAFCPIGGRPV